MKNYEDMSDFEINCRVHAEIMQISGLNSFKAKDYCNNPEDAWPIIDENNITIINDHPSMRLAVNDVSGYYNGSSGIIASYDENGFRAAMIVFLKMNEGKL